MAIAGGIISAERCLYSAAGMLRFLARLSGRRRHVRSNCGIVPGGVNFVAHKKKEKKKINEYNNADCNKMMIVQDSTITDDTIDDVRHHYLSYRCNIECDDIRKEFIDDVDNKRTIEESYERINGACDLSSTKTTTTNERDKCQNDSNETSIKTAKYSYQHHHDSTTKSNEVSRFRRRFTIPSYLATLLVISYTLFGIADACSSRSTPKPRPPTPTPRPNITFHMYTCPHDYAEWYCLNGATCFTVKIQESLLYNCLCASGFVGQRCEFKDLDGSYMTSKRHVMLETASIAGGATIAVFLVVIICVSAYIHCKRKQKELQMSSDVDTVDGPGRDPELRPFCKRSSLIGFKAKNQNCSPAMCLPIEQTRMSGWIDYSQVEMTRLASINEAKRSSQ
ncbi:hypothetical protein HCN44_000459 [Aphidius gifuensis]|uniref:EGF-like domain-containing protein n=1 Tax=Aphidius gifuensis TaxID=684658 RepID=A0A834XSV8_APHGI|nr:uncharacterized protein LOC122854985 [Aphidius gifuensis]KAF7990654.1 hypothetical protein HCN44_000459 [Aphidius gifuensis]